MQKQYIEPQVKIAIADESFMIQTSDKEGYGDPMSKESNFLEEEGGEEKTTRHSVWEDD